MVCGADLLLKGLETGDRDGEGKILKLAGGS